MIRRKPVVTEQDLRDVPPVRSARSAEAAPQSSLAQVLIPSKIATHSALSVPEVVSGFFLFFHLPLNENSWLGLDHTSWR
jgi:hypothetical protein